MSDERFRQVVRRALNPVVGDVGDGPPWGELTSGGHAPPSTPGWRIAVSAAAVVAVVIGITAVIANDSAVTDDPMISSPTTTDNDPTESGIVVTPEGEIVFPEGVHPTDALQTASGVLIVITDTEAPEDGGPPAERALISAIDPETGSTHWSQPLEDGPSRLASDNEAVWVAHFRTGALTKLSLATGEVLATSTPELPFDFGSGPDRNQFIPNDLEVAFGSVWMSTARGAVARFDIEDGTVRSVIPILVDGTPGYVGGVDADDEWLWIVGAGGLDRLDPVDETRRRLTTEQLGQRAGSVIVIEGSVLVGGTDEREGRNGRLVVVDAETMTIGDGLDSAAGIEVVEIAEQPIAWTEGELRPITFFPPSLGAPLDLPSMTGEPSLASSDPQWLIRPESRSLSRIGAAIGPTTELPTCAPGVPRRGIDLRFEDLIRYYNVGDAEQMILVIGDGPVADPSLAPDRDVIYPSVTAWLDAAQRVGDSITTNGYGMGEPFYLYINRRNASLEADGIESLSLTFRIWANQNCELRVETTNEASSPDACRYSRLYEPDDIPTGCTGPYVPRSGHVAVWTGEEVLIVGGTSGTQPIQPPIALRPDGAIRQLADPPLSPGWYPGMTALWTGQQMLIATGLPDYQGMVVLSYTPATDTWTVSDPIPDGQYLEGAVWTGSELVLVGGVQNLGSDQAWSFNPSTGDWTRLPDPGIPRVEGMEGVWTGTEAIFYGGYAGGGESPGVAWNPATRTWRTLAPADRGHIQEHHLVWTGEHVIVYSGHSGPSHPDRLLLYDPAADAWTESAPIPITPVEHLGAAWTGQDLILWGGAATYGDRHTTNQGALYNPTTDTWTVMADSPLSPRCDHTLTWTDDVAIVFGGIETCGSTNFIASGHAAIYDVADNEWRVLEP